MMFLGSATSNHQLDTSLFADAELDGVAGRVGTTSKPVSSTTPEIVSRKQMDWSRTVVGQLVSGFTEARSRLEQQWSRGEEASTEDLRVALKRYREFFDRLLAV